MIIFDSVVNSPFLDKDFAETTATKIAETMAKNLRYNIKNCVMPEKVYAEDGDEDNQDLITLLLVKYIYYKIIIGNNVEAKKLLLITTDNLMKAKIYNKKTNIIDSRTIIDNIVDQNNNITISDKDLAKCLHILRVFSCLKCNYCGTCGLAEETNEIQNYDKFITKSFFNNIDKLSIIKIMGECEDCIFFNPIILPSKNNPVDKTDYVKNFCKPYDVLWDMSLVVDWLFQNCKHIETFEIGLFAATSQALFITEGFDAFTKFVTYAKSLDDENRVNLVNKLIAYYNIITKKSETIHKLVDGNVILTTVLEFIPNIIKSFNLCETIHAYPESMTASIIEANNKNNNLYNNFTDIAKKYTYFIRAINGYKSKPENFVKINEFNRDKTIPMQTIINEYYKFQHYKHKK